MNQKRKLLVLAGIILLAIAGLLIAASSTFKKTPVQPQEVDLNLPKSVVIENSGGLQKILLSRQYEAVAQELSNYIKANFDKNIVKATITNGPTLAQDGKISFTIKTAAPEKEFVVTLDRLTYFDKVIFSVPTENYQKTLEVFADQGGGDD